MDYKVTTEPVAEPVSVDNVKTNSRINTDDDDTYIASLIKTARKWCESYLNRPLVVRTITAKLDKFSDPIELPLPPLIAVDSITYIDSNGDTQTLATTVYDVDTTSEPGKVTLAYNQSWPTIRGDHHGITITYKCGYACKFTTDYSSDANKLTIYGRTFSDGDIVRLFNTASDLPEGLSADTDYYVVNSVANTSIELATSEGGTPITLTDDGSGTSFVGVIPENFLHAILLLAGDLYENREDTSSLRLVNVPNGVERLLNTERIWPI